MGFLAVYRAVYDYDPQAENELAISDGDLLFITEKGEDDWWTAKKKAASEDEDEPEGLVPRNYIEEATPTHRAKALYDYTRQTDEELSFAEDAELEVFDASDPDWTLVGHNGDFGFAPSNYIEVGEGTAEPEPEPELASPPLPTRPRVAFAEPEPEPEPEDEPGPPTPSSGSTPTQSPAAALAGIIAKKSTTSAAAAPRAAMASPPLPQRPQYTPEESEDEAPMASLPRRQPSEAQAPPVQYATSRSAESDGVRASPGLNRISQYGDEDRMPTSPRGFHLYNIHEMVSAMGKSKKMPMTLGINVAKGVVMISPEKSRDGPSQEWTAEKLTHYSIEGKHVFMELVRPSKSVDFHAGAKDTAQEIVKMLGELAGAARAEGLREVFAATSGGAAGAQKSGKMLYEFMAQGDDEVTVAENDEVLVLDDKDGEWWQIRRLKNGKEGVVPASYVEITGTTTIASPTTSLPSTKNIVEQNRREEERITREAMKRRPADARGQEVGPGFQLPQRGSSLLQAEEEGRRGSGSQRGAGRRDGGKDKDGARPKPNSAKVRKWSDKTGAFNVDAEFLGLKDNKIHLHKMNGVKIAVPVAKMSLDDIEYVERVTGVSLDDEKPLSEIKRKSTIHREEASRSARGAGAAVEQNKKPEYDWFDFFLQCGVNPQICEKYAQSFNRDQMGEENMQDISEKLLRTLGLKEGDILRVTRFLDAKYGRVRAEPSDNAAETNGSGGMFSGPGGALKNNTSRKGRPAPPVTTNDTIDPKVFEQGTGEQIKQRPADAVETPLGSAPARQKQTTNGFDDDAWAPRAAKSATASTTSPPPAAAAAAPPPAQAQVPALTGAAQQLSLLDAPLVPTPAPQPAPQQQATSAEPARPTGATPSLFEQIANQPPPPQQAQPTSQTPQQQFMPPRQRPMAPQQTGAGGVISPPPARVASAPIGMNQQSQFTPPPLAPQLTGYHPAGNIHTNVAPPGQSMQELAQQKLQQTFPLQAQPTGFPQQQQPGYNQFANGLLPQPTGYNPQFGNSLQPQPTGFNPQFNQLQSQATGFSPYMNGQQQPQPNGSPFADPPRLPFQPQPSNLHNSFAPMQAQPTGFPQQMQPLQPQATGINAFLPPALVPQPTGFGGSPVQQGLGGFNAPPVPPMPPMPQQQQQLQPLVPQKTGPAPNVKFGMQAGQKKLVPQPTGKRANLNMATAQNPFGF